MHLKNEIEDWCCKSVPTLGWLRLWSGMASLIMVSAAVAFLDSYTFMHMLTSPFPMISKVLLSSAFILWLITRVLVKHYISRIVNFVHSLSKWRSNDQVHSELLRRIMDSKQVPDDVKTDISIIASSMGCVTYGHLFALDEMTKRRGG